MLDEYREFKWALRGYAEVPLKEYRERIAPLKRKRAWDAEDRAYVSELDARGALPALWALCRAPAPAHGACRALYPREPRGFPQDKPALAAQLRSLLANCKRESWPASRYKALVAYYDSKMTVAQLADSTKPPLPPPASVAAPTPAPTPAPDAFAEAYRDAHPLYQAEVRRLFEEAARAAR